MKKLIFATAILLAMAAINSCKKNDTPTFFKENCRVLATIAPVAGPYPSYTTTYTYDAKGYINSELTKMGEDNIEIRYNRKNNGQIESADLFYQGESIGTRKYTYQGRRVVRMDYFNAVGSSAGYLTEIKYNNRGLIVEINSKSVDNPESGDKNLFEYNSLGQVIKTIAADSKGNIYFYDTTIQRGTPSPSSQIYLMEHGLPPFDALFFTVYGYSDPGIGSITEYYSNDRELTGNFRLWSTRTVKSKTLNARGYTESIEYQDEKGNSSIAYHQFDCGRVKGK